MTDQERRGIFLDLIWHLQQGDDNQAKCQELELGTLTHEEIQQVYAVCETRTEMRRLGIK